MWTIFVGRDYLDIEQRLYFHKMIHGIQMQSGNHSFECLRVCWSPGSMVIMCGEILIIVL
jgi:hypothetical protein